MLFLVALMFTANPKWYHCNEDAVVDGEVHISMILIINKNSRRTYFLKYYELNVLHALSHSLLIILGAGLTINSILQIRYVKRLRNLLKVFSHMVINQSPSC